MSPAVKAYWQLTKPGVLYGNVLTGVAGYLLAAQGGVDWVSFFAMLIGMTMVVAAACVINNYLDQDIDKVMERTKKRPSVTGALPGSHMVIYGTLLGVIGITILYLGTNWLTVWIGIIGFITYVWLYGALSKRQSVYGTHVGSISGALPIAGGYAAVTGVIDPGLIIVFLILFFWQFPEFFSIGIYRRKEYAAAKVPIWPVVRGVPSTIKQIFVYTILYVAGTLALVAYGYVGYSYLVVMTLFGVHWIWLGSKGFSAKQPEKWARKMFRYAMINLLVLCAAISVGPLLP